MKPVQTLLLLLFFCLLITSCSNNEAPSKEAITALDLKKGALVSCGAANQQFGTVSFNMSCDEKVKSDFNLAMELLHSFEYDEAEKVFAKIIDQSPNCAMASWGIAMSNFHPLWTPPTEPELKKGLQALQIAKAIGNKSARETGYINAIAQYYDDWKNTDHHTRCLRFEKAMEKLHNDCLSYAVLKNLITNKRSIKSP